MLKEGKEEQYSHEKGGEKTLFGAIWYPLLSQKTLKGKKKGPEAHNNQSIP